MINKVILIGNVGADPEIRTLEGGVKVGRLRVATSERMYNRQTQEAKDHTEWHSITVWRNMADYVDRFVKKGSQVYIEGRIRSRDWTDGEGHKRYSIEIVADELRTLGRRPEGAAMGNEAPQSVGQSYSAAAQVSQPVAAPVAQPAAAPAPTAAPAPAPTPTPPPVAAPQPTQASAGMPPMEDPDDLPF